VCLGNDDDSLEENVLTKEIRPDQMWAMLLSVMHMSKVCDDKRNRMSTELIAAELKIRLNSSLSCTDGYDFFLSKPELLKLIHSNEKYCLKKQRVN
jgi:hypothetical protein